MLPSVIIRASRNLTWRIFHGKSYLKKNTFQITNIQIHSFSSKSMKVAVLGAASKTGNLGYIQFISLLYI